jgi:uncharacterized protein YbjT (DUF2867 family)
MRDRTAIVIGATGLTGELLLEKLLQDKTFGKVRVLSRRAINNTDKPSKPEGVIVNFSNLADLKKAIGHGDIIFSCIGTTMKSVKGDKLLYRSIDYDINVNCAKLGYENGVSKFVLMSAVGANAASSNFYLKLKGETEQAVASVPFESVHVMQPSMLLGKRKEHRAGESVARVISKAISFLFVGKLQKYKPVESATVADAMIAASKVSVKGVHTYTYAEMTKLLA